MTNKFTTMLAPDKAATTSEQIAEVVYGNISNRACTALLPKCSGHSACRMRYGQTTYDFQEGGMFFTSPGQPLAGIQVAESTLGFTLLVHPDFLRNYPLDAKIKHYGFFSYSVTESLHLSDKEKSIIEGIAGNIGDELETAIDDLSQDVLISQLELMLNYSQLRRRLFCFGLSLRFMFR